MTDQSPDRAARPQARRGRRRATTPEELERAAFDLFDRHGFDATTVDTIAAAAGIGRRTFFRYFDSKNDVVWGSFDAQLELMRAKFAQCPGDQPLLEAVRGVVVDFNTFDPAEVPWHRKRMELILRVPALQAHSTLRYAQWRAVVAEFAARRLGLPRHALTPQTIAHTALGVALAAYEHWLAHQDTELSDVLDGAFGELATGFSGLD